MSNRGLMLGVGIVGGVIALEYTGYGPFSRSSGVQNIEKSWSRGGGSDVHTPATASPRGNYDNVVGRDQGIRGLQNPNTVKGVNESRVGNDTIVASRNKREDRDTPGGPGTGKQGADQAAHTATLPLEPGSPSKGS